MPYVNLWGPEETGRFRLAHDPHVGRRAVFLDDADELVPDFTRQNMGRQRRCMAEGLCQVCGRPVPWSRRFLVLAPLSVEWVEVGGRERPVIHEPWLDERCAAIATGWCPALIRRRRDEELHTVPVRSKLDVELVLSVGRVDGPLAAETAVDPVAMWLKVALLRHNILRAPVSS